MNIRDEAILREFNIYPLWVRREVHSSVNIMDTETTLVNSKVVNEDQEINTSTTDNVVTPTVIIEKQVEVEHPKENKLHQSMVGETDWPLLKQQVHGCTACNLRQGCTQTVFGVGDEVAEWLFVGEGPGADEDAMGEPFVGQAGKLLDNILAAIKLKRGENVYIANVVKCRPPNNRTPAEDEIGQCLPYLQRQIALIKPKIIVALGKTAATALLGRDATLGSLRSQVHEYQGIPLIITFHPAYLLRSPAEKAKAWQDLCFAVTTLSAIKK